MIYKHHPGDRVKYKGKKYIIAENYYPDGFGKINIPAYTVYPPGKKKSYGYYFWVKQIDLD